MIRMKGWMMRKGIRFSVVLLAALVFPAQCSYFREKPSTETEMVQTSGTPVVEFVETSHDMGQVAAGGEYSHEFVVRNKGTGILQIKKVLPGCGSTAFWDKTISPGKEGRIKIHVIASQCSDYYKRSIVVTTNDPKTPYRILYLTGHR
jgi:hypothetical protein